MISQSCKVFLELFLNNLIFSSCNLFNQEIEIVLHLNQKTKKELNRLIPLDRHKQIQLFKIVFTTHHAPLWQLVQNQSSNNFHLDG